MKSFRLPLALPVWVRPVISVLILLSYAATYRSFAQDAQKPA